MYPTCVSSKLCEFILHFPCALCKIESDTKPNTRRRSHMFQTYHLSLHRIENIRFSYSTNQVLQCLHNRLCGDAPQSSRRCQKCDFFWSFINGSLRWSRTVTKLCTCVLIWSRYELGLAMRLQMMRISTCLRLYPHPSTWPTLVRTQNINSVFDSGSYWQTPSLGCFISDTL